MSSSDADGNGSALDHRGERLAVDELGRHVEDSAVGADVMDAEDVGMIERGRRVRFLLEPGTSRGIAGDVGRQHLERHLAAKPRIARAIDLAHPACPQRRDDLVGPDPASRRQRAAHRHARDSIVV